MGYGAMAWAVDLDRVRSTIGSGDAALVQRYGVSFTDRYDELQQSVQDTTSGAVTLADVARHMIMAQPYDDRIGYAYGYFLEHLCDRLGTFLDNQAWMPVPVDYCERVDNALADAGLLADGFTTSGLVFGGAPVPLPRIDDFPGIGFREFGTLEEPAQRLSYAATAEIDTGFINAACDVFQWLSQAHSTGRSVVVFFH